MNEPWITPPNHVDFLAKPLFGALGKIKDGSIARLAPGGGGPTAPHTHAHNHLFIVTEGKACIHLGEETIIVNANESFLVKGTIPHSVWNETEEQTVMIGITVL